jgi:hypothetical protein
MTGKRKNDCKHCDWMSLRYYKTHTRKNEKNHHKFKDTHRHAPGSLCTTVCRSGYDKNDCMETAFLLTELRNSTTKLTEKKKKGQCLRFEFSQQTFEDHHLGCDAMQCGRYVLAFHRNPLIHQT